MMTLKTLDINNASTEELLEAAADASDGRLVYCAAAGGGLMYASLPQRRLRPHANLSDAAEFVSVVGLEWERVIFMSKPRRMMFASRLKDVERHGVAVNSGDGAIELFRACLKVLQMEARDRADRIADMETGLEMNHGD